MPTLEAVAAHCRDLDCQVALDTSSDREIIGFAHTEDARPGHLCWFRGGTLDAFAGSALVAHIDAELASSAAPLVVHHRNPRKVLRSLIETYFVAGRPRVVIGEQCRIHSSAVLGADGQGYDWTPSGWSSFPHIGDLRVEDDVEIGPASTIMRGSVGATVVGRGTKIGNGVNVGHDTRIGKHALIVAHASLAGWVRVGNHAKIWQGAVVKNGVRIGEGAVIGMGAVVLKDVPAGQTWVGNPARKAC